MTEWIRFIKPSGSPDELGPLQLAWLGDAVWEMHHRLRLCKTPGRSKDLHESVVSEVKAEAQAKALDELDQYLNQEEKGLVKKGRNRVGRVSRKVNVATYAKATGFETLIGWLFLKNPERLANLFDQLDSNLSNPP